MRVSVSGRGVPAWGQDGHASVSDANRVSQILNW